MDLGRAFRFMFNDPGWLVKLLIGGVVALIPVIGSIVVSGYSYTVARNVARGNDHTLPEWNEFGDMLVRGLIGIVVGLAYGLPAILIGGCLGAALGTAGATAERDGGGGGIAALAVCVYPIFFLALLVCNALALVAIARYLATDQFGEAFKVGAVFADFRNNLGLWVQLLLLAILASLVATLGLIALFIGVLFTAFYAQVVIGHGLGQVIARVHPAHTSGTPGNVPSVTSF